MEMKVQAIAKRKDTSPEEGKSKYGDVKYADEKNKKYPLDTEKHVRAALSYWGMPKNRAKYSSEDQKTIGGKIRAAAKKFGIGTSSDGGDGDKKKAQSHLISCDFSTHHFDGAVANEIVFMPKGRHTISPSVSGQRKEITLDVDENAAMVLIDDLQNRLAEHVRPIGGFDHKPGAASFFPKAMRWDDDRGIMLEVDWTDAGAAAIAGRNYGHFSPTFLWDGERIEGLPAHGEIGSLTNNPAFDDPLMARIAASNDTQITMSKISDRLVELEVITAEQAEGADEEFLIRAINGLHEQLACAQAANARLSSENTSLAAKVQAVVKSEAEGVVQAAIAEGKIGSKDQTSIDFWTTQLLSSPETTKKVLAAMPKNEALKTVINVTSKDAGKGALTAASKTELVAAQHRAVRAVQKANPKMDYPDAFNQARADHPELFPVEG
jgi:phage I-like protein